MRPQLIRLAVAALLASALAAPTASAADKEKTIGARVRGSFDVNVGLSLFRRGKRNEVSETPTALGTKSSNTNTNTAEKAVKQKIWTVETQRSGASNKWISWKQTTYSRPIGSTYKQYLAVFNAHQGRVRGQVTLARVAPNVDPYGPGSLEQLEKAHGWQTVRNKKLEVNGGVAKTTGPLYGVSNLTPYVARILF